MSGLFRWLEFAMSNVLSTVFAKNETVRGDWFETTDNSFTATDNNDESGWAATLAYKRALVDFADLVVELVHVESDRPSRLLNAGIAAEQAQTTFQSSIRFKL